MSAFLAHQKLESIELQVRMTEDAFQGIPFGSPERRRLEVRVRELYSVRQVLGWIVGRNAWPQDLGMSRTKRIVKDVAVYRSLAKEAQS